MTSKNKIDRRVFGETEMDRRAYTDQVGCGGPKMCSRGHMNSVNAKVCWKCGEPLMGGKY